MKLAYKHLINFIPSQPSIQEISQKLFQLGHEHEIQNNIFDIELTPNRGDCISIQGLLRDLGVFYEVKLDEPLYKNDIKPLDINFTNKAHHACPHISFLKIDIDSTIQPYRGSLKKYFDDLDVKNNNFFTDISNYISYETGQPTHCYDACKIGNTFSLEIIKENYKFETLLGEIIELEGENLVFLNENNSVINLAGVIGGKNTCCSDETRSVIIECAYFNPENIIGKSVRYDLKSDAAHKFERKVDPLSHDKILRRFLRIVEEHAVIKNIEILSKDYEEYLPIKVSFNLERINKILGIKLGIKEFESYLTKLNFEILNDVIIPPSYRGDIHTENDIAEEIARVIGYDNIVTQPFKIPKSLSNDNEIKVFEKKLKNFLKDNGFYEVINNPFINANNANLKYSIKVDNPLDSNKKYLRTNLQKSLVDNLLYNEKRQEDSVKLYEIADVYYFDKEIIKSKRLLGIICAGRVGKNYLDFSKKINKKYLLSILNKVFPRHDFSPLDINRDSIKSKSNNQITYIEIELKSLMGSDHEFPNYHNEEINKRNFVKYVPISNFPSSIRDLSFAIKNADKFSELQSLLLNYNDKLIKDSYIFDFYNDKNKDEIKIGIRLVFQSKSSTITDSEVNEVVKKLISKSLSIESVYIPGLQI